MNEDIMQPDDFHSALNLVVAYGFQEDQPDNSDRANIVTFKYPRRGHLYLALAGEAFLYIICKGIGTISDGYVPNSKQESTMPQV